MFSRKTEIQFAIFLLDWEAPKSKLKNAIYKKKQRVERPFVSAFRFFFVAGKLQPGNQEEKRVKTREDYMQRRNSRKPSE